MKFAAGAMRVAALLSIIAGGTGAYAVLSPSQLQVVRLELPQRRPHLWRAREPVIYLRGAQPRDEGETHGAGKYNGVCRR